MAAARDSLAREGKAIMSAFYLMVMRVSNDNITPKFPKIT